MASTFAMGEHDPAAATGYRMNLRFIDWIWNVRGSVPLAPGQSENEAFARLDPLFHEYGTTYEQNGDTLTFSKKDQPAQDKMSVFDHGVLRIEQEPTGAVLRYRLSSRSLLFCFLAPLLFLGFALLTIQVGKLEGPKTEAAEKDKKKDVVLTQNPIDKFLGAPAPEKPKKDAKDKAEDKNKSKPTSAYVFAALFAALWLVGRVLEDRLVRSLFRKRLAGS